MSTASAGVRLERSMPEWRLEGLSSLTIFDLLLNQTKIKQTLTDFVLTVIVTSHDYIDQNLETKLNFKGFFYSYFSNTSRSVSQYAIIQ